MEKPTTNRDYWTVLDQWVVRVHGASRTQPFQPLHESFPLQGEGSESLCAERVTVCFYTGRDDSVVRGDKWNVPPTRESRAMWKNMGQWTGFTFFKRKTQGRGARAARCNFSATCERDFSALASYPPDSQHRICTWRCCGPGPGSLRPHSSSGRRCGTK